MHVVTVQDGRRVPFQSWAAGGGRRRRPPAQLLCAGQLLYHRSYTVTCELAVVQGLELHASLIWPPAP